jgi:hypothetical protein
MSRKMIGTLSAIAVAGMMFSVLVACQSYQPPGGDLWLALRNK